MAVTTPERTTPTGRETLRAVPEEAIDTPALDNSAPVAENAEVTSQRIDTDPEDGNRLTRGGGSNDGDPDPAAFRMNRIASRAHEIYLARGGEHGRDMEDWLQAEREIDREDE
jgi:hypothetical protein